MLPTSYLSFFHKRCARLLKSRSYASDMAGKRTPKSSAFGPRSGWMPARPAMLICLQVSDGIIREILEPHVVQDHEVPHRIVFIQATRGVGDLGHHLSTLTLLNLRAVIPMIVFTPNRFMSRIGNVMLWIECPS